MILGDSLLVMTSLAEKEGLKGQTSYATADEIPVVADYILWYAKSRSEVKFRRLYQERASSGVLSRDGDEGEAFQSRDLASAGPGSTTFDYEFDRRTYHPGANRHWKTAREGLDRVSAAGRLFAARNSLRYRRLLADFALSEYTNVWSDTIVGSFHEDKIYVVQTSPKVIARCLLMTTDPGALARSQASRDLLSPRGRLRLYRRRQRVPLNGSVP
jgi:adenine-specific DNA-methyltransferase